MKTVHYPSLKGPTHKGKVYYDLEYALKNPKDVEVLQINDVCTSLKGVSKLVNLKRIYFDQLNAANSPNRSLIDVPEEIGGLANLEELHLGNIGKITELPDSIGNLKKLKKLYIGGTYLLLKELPDSIGKLKNLEILIVNGVPLKNIPESIGNLTFLQTLVICRTNVCTLPESVKSLKALTYIKFEGNKSYRSKLGEKRSNLYEFTSLEQLMNCEKIHLSDELYAVLPQGFKGFPNINKMYIDCTSVSPERFGICPKLTKIHMYRTQDYTMLFQTLAKQPCLHDLKLGNYEVKKLPAGIGALRHLKNLHIDISYLDEMPEDLCELRNLENLHIQTTTLPELPKHIGKLESLRMLLISGTFRELPESIGNLKSLETLDVTTYNHTTSVMIPTCIKKLKNLKELAIISKYSEATQHIPDAIGELNGLIELRLVTKIGTGLPQATCKLQKLERLIYVVEQGVGITAGIFSGLKNLKYLALEGGFNLVEDIIKLKKLEDLYIKASQLAHLPHAFSQLASLRRFILHAEFSVFHFPDNRKELMHILPQNIEYCNMRGVDIYKGLQAISSLKKLQIAEISGKPDYSNIYQKSVIKDIPEEISCLKELKFLVFRRNLGEKAKGIVEEALPGGCWKKYFSDSVYYDRTREGKEFTSMTELFLDLLNNRIRVHTFEQTLWEYRMPNFDLSIRDT